MRDSGPIVSRLALKEHGPPHPTTEDGRGMSHSSNGSDLEKEIGFEKEIGQTHLTEAQEDAVESLTPPFTEKDDAVDAAVAGDGQSLTRVQSEKLSVNNIKSVPNGGLNAWLQVISSFFVFFNTWGIINAVRRSLAVLRLFF